MAFIQNAGRSNRDVKPVARRSGFIQSVRKMEQARFKEMNRLVRTRMLGGVGGARRIVIRRSELRFYSATRNTDCLGTTTKLK